jgi:hypothetical protein
MFTKMPSKMHYCPVFHEAPVAMVDREQNRSFRYVPHLVSLYLQISQSVPQEVGGSLIGEDGLMVMSGAE